MSEEPADGGDGAEEAEADAVDAGESTARTVDGPDDPVPDGPPGEPGGPAPTDEHGMWRWRAREVEVPMRVYKTVTVFATLIAVASVLLGFVLLDHATDRGQLPLSDVDATVALLGVGTIVFGAAVYAYSTRFRAVGMGKPNSDANQDEGDG